MPIQNCNISYPNQISVSDFKDLYLHFRLVQFILLGQETTTQRHATHEQFEYFLWYSSVRGSMKYGSNWRVPLRGNGSIRPLFDIR